ncbi:tRNA (adenosine(37)-N6)-threonylcarbamoyltransferase complex ATPase subunit type 1 TsaE [Eubacteriaceae bacterium ES3]|nr:tRNA (adenosine(37)-N6)-threonylcarbamoyltransferase complex ATPase subunit type 1 TsaE [Eubacteriaceae bacterium ES3]
MTISFEFESQSDKDTLEFGRQLGKMLGFPFVILLKGEMGAGKTLMTRGIAAGLGIGEDAVSSPTYTIVNVYSDKLYHFDLYRLSDHDELYEMGFYDYLDQKAGLIIEWPDLVEAEKFDRCLEIRIESKDYLSRKITFATDDDQIAEALKTIG